MSTIVFINDNGTECCKCSSCMFILHNKEGRKVQSAQQDCHYNENRHNTALVPKIRTLDSLHQCARKKSQGVIHPPLLNIDLNYVIYGRLVTLNYLYTHRLLLMSCICYLGSVTS